MNSKFEKSRMAQEMDFCTALDKLSFSSEAKNRMVQQLECSAESQKKTWRARRMATVALAAALVIALGIGAGASGALKSVKEAFSPFLGGAVAQTEIIDKIGHPLGAKASGNGITITAEAIMGDKYHACIEYVLEKDDGSRFLPEGTTAEELRAGVTSGPYSETGNSFYGYFLDEDPEDNQIRYLLLITGDQDELQLGDIESVFQEIYYYPGGGREPESLLNIEPVILFKGMWRLRFEAAYEDSAIELEGGEPIVYKDCECAVRELSVSSLGFHLVLEADGGAWKKVQPEGYTLGGEPTPNEIDPVFLVDIPVQMKKTDGTVLDFAETGGGVDREDGKVFAFKGAVFPEVIPLEELESITINGTEYRIDR